MGRLDYEDYMPHAPPEVGTGRVNHDNCTAGIDTRRRLYVTRKEDNSVVAYCHNCGFSGFSRSTRRHRVVRIPRPPEEVKEKIAMPKGIITDTKRWPPEMKDYLKKCHVNLTTAGDYGICYDAQDKRMIIPKLYEGELVMFQSRRLFDDGTPKYLTYKEEHGYLHEPMQLRRSVVASNTCIITEDVISAIRCAELGFTAVPLMGTNLPVDVVLTLRREYATIVVWLDNDGVGVNRIRDEIVRILAVTGLTVVTVSMYKDPKYINKKDLNEILLTEVA